MWILLIIVLHLLFTFALRHSFKCWLFEFEGVDLCGYLLMQKIQIWMKFNIPHMKFIVMQENQICHMFHHILLIIADLWRRGSKPLIDTKIRKFLLDNIFPIIIVIRLIIFIRIISKFLFGILIETVDLV